MKHFQRRIPTGQDDSEDTYPVYPDAIVLEGEFVGDQGRSCGKNSHERREILIGHGVGTDVESLQCRASGRECRGDELKTLLSNGIAGQFELFQVDLWIDEHFGDAVAAFVPDVIERQGNVPRSHLGLLVQQFDHFNEHLEVDAAMVQLKRPQRPSTASQSKHQNVHFGRPNAVGRSIKGAQFIIILQERVQNIESFIQQFVEAM
mmetsp:Transcript_23376/g.48391  ORF Transcript_23376/g.48391 Transcript_23376/m.48391 type:complete len:205 (+) Transcript_23376:927-1541(+)